MPMALVTGGAGFIGSHLVEALLARGMQVRVLDNLSTGSLENLRGLRAEFVEGDIRDREAVDRAMRGVERVFHLAAMISVPGSMADPIGCYESNLMGSLRVLEAAREHGVRAVVLASSAAVYGEVETPVDEDIPPHPQSPYAASKLAMEQAGRLYAEIYDLPVVSLRFFNVYGPRQSPDSPYAAVIPAFIRALLDGRAPVIYGDGGQMRDFIFVGDVARAMILASESEHVAGEVFNIGSGTAISIQELAAILCELMPGAPGVDYGPSRPGDIRFSSANIENARQRIDFYPEVALEAGLMKVLQWFRSVRS